MTLGTAPLSMGFSRQEDWSGLPCPPPGDPLDSGTEPGSPAPQAGSLPLSHQGSPWGLADVNYYIQTGEATRFYCTAQGTIFNIWDKP